MASGAFAAWASTPRLRTTWSGGAETVPVPVTSRLCTGDGEAVGATVAAALEWLTGDGEPHDTMATATALVVRAVSPRCIFMVLPPPAAKCAHARARLLRRI